jgi:hypothetical protein
MGVPAKVITCLSFFMAVPCTKMPKIYLFRSIFPLNESKMVKIFRTVVKHILGYIALNFQHHTSPLAKVITYLSLFMAVPCTRMSKF